MHNAMQNAANAAILSMLFDPRRNPAVEQFLYLEVTREKLVEDTLRELSGVSDGDLKKPLKVKFYGEEAEDAGGVRKEFFLLLLRKLLNPEYGMFREYEETRALWFSDNSFEELEVYGLIGNYVLSIIQIFKFISI